MKKFNIAGLFVLLSLIFFIYSKTIYLFFTHDDFWLLNAVREPIPNIYMAVGSLVVYVRPISTYWFPLLCHSIFGLNSYGHHALLLSVFVGSCYFLFAYLNTVTKDWTMSLIGTAFYALSEVHVYTLSWIAGSSDIVAFFFLLMAMYLYEKCKSYWWSIIAFILAILSKEPMAVIFFLFMISTVFSKLRIRFILSGIVVLILWFIWYSQMLIIHPYAEIIATMERYQNMDLSRTVMIMNNAWASIIHSSKYVSLWFWIIPAVIVYFEWTRKFEGLGKGCRVKLEGGSYTGIKTFVGDVYLVCGEAYRYTINGALSFALLLCVIVSFMYSILAFPSQENITQLYYAQYCVLGLIIIFTIAFSNIKNVDISFGLILILLVCLIFGGFGINKKITEKGVPALFFEAHSRTLKNYLDESLTLDNLDVKIGVDELTWISTGDGYMFEVFYPEYNIIFLDDNLEEYPKTHEIIE